MRLLGQGSYGKVWIVHERGVSTQFVMKEIRPVNAEELRDAVRCFDLIWSVCCFSCVVLRTMRSAAQPSTTALQISEADIMHKLKHPHIIECGTLFVFLRLH